MESQPIFKLVVEQGPTPGQEFELVAAETVIGRDSSADITIPSPVVSRRHARLIPYHGQYLIEDLGSSNGTFLNGRKLNDPKTLNTGDQIGLGRAITLIFEAPHSPDYAAETRRSAGAPPQKLVPGEAVAPQKAEKRPGLATTVQGKEVNARAESGPPQFVVTIAGEQPRTYTLTQPILTIGRLDDNDIVIDSKIVSRRHARLERDGNSYRLVAFPEASNLIHVQGQPLTEARLLRHQDILRIGGQDPGLMVSMSYHSPGEALGQAAHSIEFGSKTVMQIGRDPSSDIVLDAPTISRFHAQIERVGQRYRLQDLRSSNGTFVNDQRIDGEVWLKLEDTIRIGPYRFIVGQEQLAQYDESSGLQVDVVGLNKWVRKDLNILQDISLSFRPREFVVIVGQSGGGKSTLVDAIAGYRPATHGQVYVNGADIYRHFDALRSEIGFVPQRDIIHMELTVYQALDYAARLRMPRDTSKVERHQRVMEVLQDLDLLHRKDVQISGLSGGQQKRVSIGVELLTRPGLFFLDEPTSGLDPGTETALMQLMRRLADQGRTIVLITHATKNVMLADKVVFLTRGGYLAWFGPPDEALKYFNQYRSERERRTVEMEFDQIYAVLDDPSKGSPREWGERYRMHTAYRQYVLDPLREHGYQVGRVQPSGNGRAAAAAVAAQQPATRRQRRNQISALRQFFILSSRNIKILTRDRFSLFLMLAAAPLVGMLDFVLAGAMGSNPFDYVDGNFPGVTTSLFLLTVYGVMVGGLSQMREIVKEQQIYRRERLVNLKIFPYILSKVWVAGLLALYHTAAYVIIHYLAFDMPGGVSEFIQIYISLALATMTGMMLGLFASVLSPNANAAPLVVILLMLPQIVLGGALIPLPDAVSAPTSTRWAFEAFMGTSGVGSDVAKDPCWILPEETRQLLTIQDKDKYGCNCMGASVMHADSCQFPGLGQFYDPVLDQPPPAEPSPLGDPPPEPILPDPPVEPQDQSDNVAMAQYLEDLKAYQAEVDRIQADYKAEMDVYQARADVYQGEVIAYQQELAEWQIARNAAIGKAEALIEPFQRDFGWTFLHKDDTPAYWSRVTTTWAAQTIIALILFVAILFLMKRKDKIA